MSLELGLDLELGELRSPSRTRSNRLVSSVRLIPRLAPPLHGARMVQGLRLSLKRRAPNEYMYVNVL